MHPSSKSTPARKRRNLPTWWESLPPEIIGIIKSYAVPSILELRPLTSPISGLIYASSTSDKAWNVWITRESAEDSPQTLHVLHACRRVDLETTSFILCQVSPARIINLSLPNHVVIMCYGGSCLVWNLLDSTVYALPGHYLEMSSLSENTKHQLISTNRTNVEVLNLTMLPGKMVSVSISSERHINAIGSLPLRSKFVVLYSDSRTIQVYSDVHLVSLHTFQIPTDIDISRVFPTITSLGSGLFAILSRACYRNPSKVLLFSIFGDRKWVRQFSLQRKCTQLYKTAAHQFIVYSSDGVHSYAFVNVHDPLQCRLIYLQHIYDQKGSVLGHDGHTLCLLESDELIPVRCVAEMKYSTHK